MSDEEGVVRLFIPLVRQRRSYPVIASSPLINDSIIMPLAGYEIIQVE